jgi:hypothetical protein
MSTASYRLVAVLGLALTVARCAASGNYGNVELLRDSWGIPHVFSDTCEMNWNLMPIQYGKRPAQT